DVPGVHGAEVGACHRGPRAVLGAQDAAGDGSGSGEGDDRENRRQSLHHQSSPCCCSTFTAASRSVEQSMARAMPDVNRPKMRQIAGNRGARRRASVTMPGGAPLVRATSPRRPRWLDAGAVEGERDVLGGGLALAPLDLV